MKNTTLLLSATMILSACSKTVTEMNEMKKDHLDQITMPQSQSLSGAESLKTLLNSDAPNLALAELLAKTIPKEHKDALKEIMAGINADEATTLILEVQKQNESIRKDYLFHGQSYQYRNREFLSHTIGKDVAIGNISIENQLKVSVFSYIKNKTLDEIISAYDKRADELTKELSKEVAYEIGTKNPNLARQIENSIKTESVEKVIETIKKSQEVVSKVDRYFRSSDLNHKEQYVTILSAAIAGGIYLQVKDNAGFKNIIEQGKNIVRDIKELEKKAKEAVFLIKTLNEHLDSTAKNIRDFSDGMRESKDEISSMYKQARSGIANSDNIQAKKIVNFLYNKVIKGKDVKDDGTNSSIIPAQNRINSSIKKSVNAVGDMADNLSTIIATTNKFAALFGVKPSKDLQKVMDKAQKIAMVVSSVRSIATAYFTAGPVAAATAFASGPMMGSLMGGSGSADSAKLDEISRKLDIIIENQRKIMEMQIETMKMIKDLALMIDRYHQEQMVALAELRDTTLVTMEITKLQLNKDIRSCERMIDFQLKSIWDRFNFGSESFQSINHIKLINANFLSSINDLSSLKRIVTSVEEDGFRRCQVGIAEAFSGNTSAENPIRAIFSSTDSNNLTKFERETYLPLLASLQYFTQTSSFNSIPLHFPMNKVSDLDLKIPFIDYAKTEPVIGHEIYDIENLISTKALERYLSNLLILHPLLETDKDAWFGTHEEIINTYLANANIGANQNTRSGYFLENALKLTQSAIAQEAIMAGEPILHKLHEYNKDIISHKKCTEKLTLETPYTGDMPFLCAVRNNMLLMKNYLMYSFHYKNKLSRDFFDHYEHVYKLNDLPALAKLINAKLPETQLKLQKNDTDYDIVLQLSGLENNQDKIQSIKLPTPEALREGQIMYSENMPRLLLMQELIMDNLTKVVPVKRSNGKNGLTNLILLAN